jgi:GT2 family glycosyltransferase
MMKVPMKVLITVVRYKMALEDSATVNSLAASFAERPGLLGEMCVLLWDNSPAPLSSRESSFPLAYRFSEVNLGVSGAYNGALAFAEQEGIPWLLLLDQDTVVTATYLASMLDYGKRLLAEERVAAVVPFIRANGSLVSPRIFGKAVRNHQIARTTEGIFCRDGYAVNSGSMIRTSALRQVGGYSNTYWLDLSDAYIFHVLHLQGKCMYIAGDLELQHSIATLNFDQDMSPARYANFLAAENSFAAEFRGFWQNVLHSVWLLARAARQYRRYQDKSYARLTLKSFRERILLSPAKRRKRWHEELNRRNLPAVSNGQLLF